jgi:hypothetical protein
LHRFVALKSLPGAAFNHYNVNEHRVGYQDNTDKNAS